MRFVTSFPWRVAGRIFVAPGRPASQNTGSFQGTSGVDNVDLDVVPLFVICLIMYSYVYIPRRRAERARVTERTRA